jgi:hypothetical protein
MRIENSKLNPETIVFCAGGNGCRFVGEAKDFGEVGSVLQCPKCGSKEVVIEP